jgi:alanine dehydrogenase
MRSLIERNGTMRIGIPREIKDGERRVALVPDAVRALTRAGHFVAVETQAGAASGFPDDEFRAAGAAIEPSADVVWDCTLVVKVKEVQSTELAMLRRGSTILGFAQLNRDPALLRGMLAAGVRAIAAETVRDADGALPLLAPMSRIAGRLAPLVGGEALRTDAGGNGTLITGVGDVPPARVVIVGAGNVGGEAARIAARLGCHVTVLSRGATRLERLVATLRGEGLIVQPVEIAGGTDRLDAEVAAADLVIGAVLEPGTLSPKLISRAAVRAMRPGSALVDVGIDQGGIAATSRMTSLSSPTYVDEGVVHYAVPNMPALVARTATFALAAATLPYVRALADAGIEPALDADPGLANGVMVWEGVVVHGGLATDVGIVATAAPWRAGRRRVA